MVGKNRKRAGKRWSKRVTESSNALDLEPKVFASSDPHGVAASLKRSADRSSRRKGNPFQSAMSMLNFYVNRAGSKLPAERKRILTIAKDELRRLYGKTEARSK
jgi:Protein of unknown function (DUF3175)